MASTHPLTIAPEVAARKHGSIVQGLVAFVAALTATVTLVTAAPLAHAQAAGSVQREVERLAAADWTIDCPTLLPPTGWHIVRPDDPDRRTIVPDDDSPLAAYDFSFQIVRRTPFPAEAIYLRQLTWDGGASRYLGTREQFDEIRRIQALYPSRAAIPVDVTQLLLTADRREYAGRRGCRCRLG